MISQNADSSKFNAGIGRRKLIAGAAGASLLAVAGASFRPPRAYAVGGLTPPFSTATITDTFGSWPQWRKDAGYGPHRGVDFAPGAGKAIPASGAGTVTWKGSSGPLGNMVVIFYPAQGVYFGYCHMAAASPLALNAAVSQGTVVGSVGNTGTATTGAHLHLTASLQNGNPGSVEPKDPMPYFGPSSPSQPTPAPKDTTRFAISSLGRDNTLDVYWRGTDTDPQLYHRYNTGNGWSNSEPLGGNMGSAATVLSTGATTHDVFYQGADKKLHHNWFNGSAWAGDSALPTLVDMAGSPTAVRRADGTINVFWRDVNNGLCQSYFQNGTWATSPNLASGIGGDPFAVVTASGLDVFFAGSDGVLRHVYYANGAWSSDQVIPHDAKLAGKPTAVVRGTQINVFWRGPSRGLFQSYFNGTSWAGTGVSLAEGLTVDPVAIVRGSSGMDVFYGGSGGNLRHVYYTTSWSPDTSLPATSAIAAPLSASYRTNGYENVFWRGDDGTLSQSYCDANGVWGASTPL
ncbi:M23 family metallopeptidase [Rathayibacter festucae]|uniref:peptidoglycan DD-metalloendopeptidase family protein n=1 Tax=Rathayibacter festucae TaxID=110937 RepID=UPI001FB49939|nr:peptidoglycan DD-metalloendopeptidase family protein [Rathayibacter festucae]MCJ1698409.1 M23 family metallopeptidase [Rathayibacter festucae]